jgi:hypothetical protein
MTRIAVLTVLLTVSMVGSYLTWTAVDGPGDVGDVTIYSATPEDLQKISWSSESLDVVVERRNDPNGDYHWVTATERKKVPVAPDPDGAEQAPQDEQAPEDEETPEGEAPDEGDAAPGEVDEEPVEEEPEEVPTVLETTITEFLGGKAAEDLWGQFAPLTAMRELTLSPDFDRSTLGFEESTTSIEVVRRSGPLQLTVGGETWGSKDRYVRRGQATYLVDDQTLRNLEYGKTRLMERRLYPLKEEDAERLAVRAGGQHGTFVQQNRDDRAKAFWAPESTPDEADENAELWLRKLFALRLTAYEDEAALSSPLETVLSATIQGDGKSWEITILRSVDAEEEQFYARSTFNRSLVKLTKSQTADAVADLDAIFSGDEG